MEVFLVWMDDAYDSRDLLGVFSTERKAQEFIDTAAWLGSQDRPHTYVEHHHVS